MTPEEARALVAAYDKRVAVIKRSIRLVVIPLILIVIFWIASRAWR